MHTPGATTVDAQSRPRPDLRAAALAALALVCFIAWPVPAAFATISAPQVIEGPSLALSDLGGVALAPDGTGGVVYAKEDGGRQHVFAAQYVGGAWRPAQRVDLGPTQGFASSWPVIAAGNGGRLAVVWVQEFGAADRLFSATLQPGARRFEAPVPVDTNVGDSTLGIAPSIAMAPGGQALLAYRVVTNAQPPGAADGGVLAEVRVAKLGGQLWSSLGTPVNRNLAAFQPAPTASNGPQVGIDQTGSGVVAWQELDDQFATRVYARRVFGAAAGIARQVTPRDLGGVPSLSIDGFSLSVGRFGEAAVVWRQQPAAPGASSRVWLATMPDQFATEAAAFAAPRLADGGGAAAPGGGALGVPSVSVSGSEALVGLSVGQTAQALDASEAEIAAPSRLDKNDGAADPGTVVTLSSDTAAVLAYRTGTATRGSVRLIERRSDGVLGDRVLTGPRGGVVDLLKIAGSGVGDGLVAFTQGTGAGRQLVAGVVDAAPQTFAVQAPIDWVGDKVVKLAWDPAVHGVGGVRYSVVVDDDVVAEGLQTTAFDLPTAELEDGARIIAVVATDPSGQETSSIPATLRFDASKPKLQVKTRGRRVQLRVVDGTGSGVDAATVKASLGNGRTVSARAKMTVRYAKAGRYRVVVRATDQAGNKATIRKTVRVR